MPTPIARARLFGWLCLLLSCAAAPLKPNLAGNIDRPLRYWPIDRGFEIVNGGESFNRPLYGPHSAFRVDAGDKPEFSLFLPGRGGVLRVGFSDGATALWFRDAEKIVARYAGGSMHYVVTDPAFGAAPARLDAVTSKSAPALFVAINAPRDGSLLLAYGGANGDKGSRNGDIGCERLPVSQFFALQPEHCAANQYELIDGGFVLTAKPGRIGGRCSTGAKFQLGDARQWNDPLKLFAADPSGAAPVAAAQIPVKAGTTVDVSLQKLSADASPIEANGVAAAFDDAAAEAREISRKIVVDTPDPFINSAAAALCTAADGVWDDASGAFMHGGVAWRTRLLGWRGPYSGDALGWHDRTEKHLQSFFDHQNDQPVDPAVHGGDEDANLARSEKLLHSNGDLTDAHYDMNLPAIDVLFRHILWTGDRDYAKKIWPILVRHLAWERRLFCREYGPEKLPLYEAYCCIWASDDLQYSGGGAAHATAYNLYHNRMAARIAEWIGKDPAPYKQHADRIQKALQELLWLPRAGRLAECKDWLGNQLVHPEPAVWTFYHAVDSSAVDDPQAWQMGQDIASRIARIPLRGPNVPEGCYQMPTSNWMPYDWSINNVVMAESMHTALAFWQAHRPEDAFGLFKGALLDSMYLGLAPGNVGMCTQFDAYRRESQRDFADGVGMTSRALIEGLFGIQPDAIGRWLYVQPRFPKAWNHASIEHPDVSFKFARAGDVDHYTIEPHNPAFERLTMRLPRQKSRLAGATANGAPMFVDDANPSTEPMLVVSADRAKMWEVEIHWAGAALPEPADLGTITVDQPAPLPTTRAAVQNILDPQRALRADVAPTTQTVTPEIPGRHVVFAQMRLDDATWMAPIAFTAVQAAVTAPATAPTRWALPLPPDARLESVDLSRLLNDRVTNIFKNEYRAPRSPFCSLALPKNGLGGWASNKENAEIDDSGLRQLDGALTLPSGVTFTLARGDAKNIAFVSQWDNYPRLLATPLAGRARRVDLLMAGSTNPMQSRIDNGAVTVTYADGSTARLALRNPENWWPIEQDLFIDDYAFAGPADLPPRVDLKTGRVRLLQLSGFKGAGGKVPGGAATVLDLPLDPSKELRELKVQADANDVVIGLMAATLER